MKFIHILLCPMTGVGIDAQSSNIEWRLRRREIFKQYTWHSLLNQTKQNFLIWLTWSSKSHAFRRYPSHTLQTFDSLPYWDDKFGGTLWERALNIARLIRAGRLLHIPKVLFYDKNGTLGKRVERSLAVLQPYLGGADWIYLTRLDSDDMLRADAIEQIQSVEPFEGAICMSDGYVLNRKTRELREWNPTTNPPFFTIIFKRDTFCDTKKYLQYWGDFKSHEDIPKIFKTITLCERLYCVTVGHSKEHISTTWTHPFTGREIGEAERKKEILRSFGLN